MADTLTPAERSARMARIAGKHTAPEKAVRRMATALGYRYRLHGAKLPGKPDLVFAGQRKAIFVHGCFWHRHAAKTCKLARLPKTRLDFWLPTLEGNRKRDARNRRARRPNLHWTLQHPLGRGKTLGQFRAKDQMARA